MFCTVLYGTDEDANNTRDWDWVGWFRIYRYLSIIGNLAYAFEFIVMCVMDPD